MSQHDRIVRSATVVSISVLASRLSGLVREIFMARMFGAGQAYDAFLLGFRIPNLTRDLFAEGALSSAFVPTFTHYLTTKSREQAAVLVNLVATAVILVVGGLCVLGVVFSPALVWLTAPGFQQVPGKFELAVEMTRIMFPFLLLVALAAQAMGVLNACNQFAVPAMSSTFFNLGSIGFGAALGFWAGPRLGITPIVGMAYGVVFGGALQLVWQVPSLRRSGFRFRLQWDWSHEGLRQILRLMGPAVLGSAAVQINIVVSTYFASGISDPVTGQNGPVSWLAYAFRFMQLPLGLFGVAIASATLPAISRSASSGNIDEFRQTLARSLGMVFLLTLPSSVGLIVLGKLMVAAIYQGGHFLAYDTQQTALALSCFAIGLSGYSALKVLTPAFYALNDARTPMLVSLGSILVNYGVSAAMVRTGTLGHAGLAVATSSVAIFGFVTLFWILRGRIGGIHGRALLASVAQITLASLIMGVLVALVSRAAGAAMGDGRIAILANLAVSTLAGAAAFYGLCRCLKVAELEMAGGAILSPARAWFSRQRARI
ncbi:MAG TPA: murein biosynthesis integral membrane protein MurJ [Bryobacteraceae bacterium]|nr:murein biosynthesis integral membrane protein MurJ [Bryobacteraceae bacterium]